MSQRCRPQLWIVPVILLLSTLWSCSPAVNNLPSTPAVPLTPTTGAFPAEGIVRNPGFEEPVAWFHSETSPSSGWQSSGSPSSAIQIEESGRAGRYLSHKAGEPFIVETFQPVTGLAEGWYTFSAWARASSDIESYLALICNGEEKRTYVPSPTAPGYRWVRLSVSNYATNGTCQISFNSSGAAERWASFDEATLVHLETKLTILGADISSLNKSESLGGLYYDQDGVQADALHILKDNGLNYARLRIWVDPADGYHDKAEILKMALRLKSMDIKLLVNFHYSDDWADPGNQQKPAAWQDYTSEQLTQAVYDHTYDVCRSLAAQGTPADMVQIGNEINNGMLWPGFAAKHGGADTAQPDHFDNLATLLKSGYQAVKDSSSNTQVMLHIAEGGSNTVARWWFDSITQRDVPFDIIGVSFYPYWHGSLAELQANLNDLSQRYDKDVVVAEFAYAFTALEGDASNNIASLSMAVEGYSFTPEGQRLMMRDMMALVRGIENGRGRGIFYWDATWTAVPGNGWNSQDAASGNSWENQALFDYNYQALPALAEYRSP